MFEEKLLAHMRSDAVQDLRKIRAADEVLRKWKCIYALFDARKGVLLVRSVCKGVSGSSEGQGSSLPSAAEGAGVLSSRRPWHVVQDPRSGDEVADSVLQRGNETSAWATDYEAQQSRWRGEVVDTLRGLTAEVDAELERAAAEASGFDADLHAQLPEPVRNRHRHFLETLRPSTYVGVRKLILIADVYFRVMTSTAL